MKKRNTQKGFTIIELVVVILLLGILTATALPRFMDVTDDAHAAVVSAVLGGLGTGGALFRGQWYADNQARTLADFNNLRANPYGYPVGLKSGAGATIRTVGSSAHCKEIFQNLLQSGSQPTVGVKTESGTALSGSSTVNGGGNDFVAYLVTGTSLTLNECYYIYTGQYSNNTVGTLPVIKFSSRTGAVTTVTPI